MLSFFLCVRSKVLACSCLVIGCGSTTFTKEIYIALRAANRLKHANVPVLSGFGSDNPPKMDNVNAIMFYRIIEWIYVIQGRALEFVQKLVIILRLLNDVNK